METEHDLPNPTVARILGREEEEHPMFFERDMLEYGERRAREAVAAERERAARVCEQMHEQHRCEMCLGHDDHDQCDVLPGWAYAAAIRQG